ncbi:MAG: CHASE2 domain-containing protein [Bacteroidia bacterium]|nr:CHASE2 domain-containing protein [Bacteroidia bacterium]
MLRWVFHTALVVGGAALLHHLFPPYKWGWDIHDLIYRRLPPQDPDTHIVVVDIGRMDRKALAYLLDRLSEAQPAFIGIDAVFPHPLSPEGDSLWEKALCQAHTRTTVCLAGSLDLTYPLPQAPPQAVSTSRFTHCATQAYANLLLHEPYAPKTVRTYLAYTVAGQDTHYALALQAALAIAPSLHVELPHLPATGPIRYLGNIEHFYYLNGEEVLRDSLPLQWLRGKAVLLGIADPLRQSLEDIFFTPLNPGFLRQTFPDMYGVVIHANIASMFVHRAFYKPIAEAWSYLATGIIYVLLAVLGIGLPHRFHWIAVRLSQIGALWGTVELTLWLGIKGLWFPAEPLIWGILLAGEVSLGSSSSRA